MKTHKRKIAHRTAILVNDKQINLFKLYAKMKGMSRCNYI